MNDFSDKLMELVAVMDEMRLDKEIIISVIEAIGDIEYARITEGVQAEGESSEGIGGMASDI